uniref:FTH domain-containing protein n=1 Tax=Steinernema glaseri TaxID=37863 RepID=A0A1I7Y1E7_9BILA
MQLPVDTVDLQMRSEGGLENVERFLENAGPLYNISCNIQNIKPNTIDVLIDKFVPVDGGSFDLKQPLSKDQLERLVLKCEMSDKKVNVTVSPEGFTYGSDVTDFFDFDKHYPNNSTIRAFYGKSLVIREGKKLDLFVSARRNMFEWEWCEML